MMAGNPNRWSLRPQSSSSHYHHLSMNDNSQNQFLYGSTTITASASVDIRNPINEFPLRFWSHLLLGEDKDRYGELSEQGSSLNHWGSYTRPVVHDNIHVVDVKQEQQLLQPSTCHLYDYAHTHDEIIHQNIVTSSECHWPAQQNSSALSNDGFLNFSGGNQVHRVEDKNQNQHQHQHQHNQDQSSECNSTKAGRLCKKARVQQSLYKPALKVRKEKLGDRIAALHQLVSPFGNTDTASVLSEAIGCIRFLQGQIEALSSPYMHNAISTSRHQHSEYQSQPGDLRRRGLCLVPISCTQNVGHDTSNEYWAPAAFGRGGL